MHTGAGAELKGMHKTDMHTYAQFKFIIIHCISDMHIIKF